MKHEITILYIPCPDDRVANKLGMKLIAEKAAACVQLMAAKSIYPWNGKIEKANEIILLAKTLNKKLSKVKSAIKKNHPYEVPCIISYKVQVNKEYYNWMKDILD